MKKVNMIFREKKPLFWMALAFVMMIGVLSLCVWPLFSRLSADQALWQDLMRHPLLAQGAMSVVMALQVVLAFLPGEPVELLCGYLFGTIGGMAVCVIGSMIGSALIFLLVRKLGEKAVLRMFPQEKVVSVSEDIHERMLVEHLLAQLPSYQRDVLVLKYQYGLKAREIACIVNEKVPTVKSRIRQGLARLREIMREEERG